MKRWTISTGLSVASLLVAIFFCSFLDLAMDGETGYFSHDVKMVQSTGASLITERVNVMPDTRGMECFVSNTGNDESVKCELNDNELSMEKKIDNGPKVKKGKEYKVLLPEEKLVNGSVELDGKPFVFIMNVGLLDLKPKAAFGWYLSLILDYELPEGVDMPDREAVIKMEDFIDNLSEKLAEDSEHPNALVLGRATGDGITHAMWYVNDPEKANDYLQKVISSGDYPFHFEFVMQEDRKWKEANYWLKPLLKSKK